jgi:hypothetical protein
MNSVNELKVNISLMNYSVNIYRFMQKILHGEQLLKLCVLTVKLAYLHIIQWGISLTSVVCVLHIMGGSASHASHYHTAKPLTP